MSFKKIAWIVGYLSSILLLCFGGLVILEISPIHLGMFFMLWGLISLVLIFFAHRQYRRNRLLSAGLLMILHGFCLLPFVIGVFSLILGFALCREFDRSQETSIKAS